jgi:hypothetical protein
VRSSLSRFQSVSPMSDDEMLDKQRELYHTRGSILLTKDQIEALPQTDRWAIEIIATKLYGKGRR